MACVLLARAWTNVVKRFNKTWFKICARCWISKTARRRDARRRAACAPAPRRRAFAFCHPARTTRSLLARTRRSLFARDFAAPAMRLPLRARTHRGVWRDARRRAYIFRARLPRAIRRRSTYYLTTPARDHRCYPAGRHRISPTSAALYTATTTCTFAMPFIHTLQYTQPSPIAVLPSLAGYYFLGSPSCCAICKPCRARRASPARGGAALIGRDARSPRRRIIRAARTPRARARCGQPPRCARRCL